MLAKGPRKKNNQFAEDRLVSARRTDRKVCGKTKDCVADTHRR